jgi:hypothetical protein
MGTCVQAPPVGSDMQSELGTPEFQAPAAERKVCQANALPTFSFPVCTNYSDNCLNDSKAIKHCPLTSPFFRPSVLCFYVFSSWISTVKVIIYCLLPLISPHCVCTHTHTHTHTHTTHTHNFHSQSCTAAAGFTPGGLHSNLQPFNSKSAPETPGESRTLMRKSPLFFCSYFGNFARPGLTTANLRYRGCWCIGGTVALYLLWGLPAG